MARYLIQGRYGIQTASGGRLTEIDQWEPETWSDPVTPREAMKVRCSRIDSLLKTAGFVMRNESNITNLCAYVREDRMPSLFQQIDVSFAGRHKETVFTHVAASTTKWVRVKGLCVSRLLDEIATDLDRGWSVITTDDEATIWEASVAQIGPLKVSELVSKEGPGLLERTQEVRKIAHIQLARFDREASVRDQLMDLERVSPPELVIEAHRLAAWPAVMQTPGSEEIYILACLALLTWDHGPTLIGEDPLVNDPLMWQIQLVADGILSWDHKHNVMVI